MLLYEVMFGYDGIAYGGYETNYVIAESQCHINGLLNEHHGDDCAVVSVKVIKKINESEEKVLNEVKT